SVALMLFMRTAGDTCPLITHERGRSLPMSALEWRAPGQKSPAEAGLFNRVSQVDVRACWLPTGEP
ncbi:MAG: hypothetical protein AB7U95_11745, partial [Reyranella sp.]